jgi:hypothetical protein
MDILSIPDGQNVPDFFTQDFAAAQYSAGFAAIARSPTLSMILAEKGGFRRHAVWEHPFQ